MKLIRYILLSLLILSCSENKFDKKIKEHRASGIIEFEQYKDTEPYFKGETLDVSWSISKDKAIEVSPFSLTSHRDEEINQENFESNITIMTFIYTSCGNTCPMILSNLRRLQKEIKQFSNIEILLITINPKYDSPAILNIFAKDNNVSKYNNWHFLTGKKEDIYSLARESFQADTKNRTVASDYSFLHSQNLYLIDNYGKLRGIYSGDKTSEIKYIVNAIKGLNTQI